MGLYGLLILLLAQAVLVSEMECSLEECIRMPIL